MADIKDYGELYTSDILVVGGGMAGLVTAIRAKENDPTLDILVIQIYEFLRIFVKIRQEYRPQCRL